MCELITVVGGDGDVLHVCAFCVIRLERLLNCTESSLVFVLQ